tara:strand:+ start:258 stop:566 length:309 start_codon:yes stop_codon:yes gene_type:complete
MSKQEKLDTIINSISVREIRVSKTLVSPVTGNTHTVELVADLGENDISSSILATHILGLKAETTAMLHLSLSDGIPTEERTRRMKSLKSSYSILIASEMENI